MFVLLNAASLGDNRTLGEAKTTSSAFRYLREGSTAAEEPAAEKRCPLLKNGRHVPGTVAWPGDCKETEDSSQKRW